MNNGEAIAVIAFLSPFSIVILCGLYYAIRGILREIDYALNGDKQRLMFNQLKKGDFLWVVHEDMLFYRFIKRVDYLFSGTTVRKIRIYFYGGYDHISITPKEAKTYRYGDYFSIKGDAKIEANHIKIKRQESINNVKSSTYEEILKAASEVVKHVNNIAKEYKK